MDDNWIDRLREIDFARRHEELINQRRYRRAVGWGEVNDYLEPGQWIVAHARHSPFTDSQHAELTAMLSAMQYDEFFNRCVEALDFDAHNDTEERSVFDLLYGEEGVK